MRPLHTLFVLSVALVNGGCLTTELWNGVSAARWATSPDVVAVVDGPRPGLIVRYDRRPEDGRPLDRFVPLAADGTPVAPFDFRASMAVPTDLNLVVPGEQQQAVLTASLRCPPRTRRSVGGAGGEPFRNQAFGHGDGVTVLVYWPAANAAALAGGGRSNGGASTPPPGARAVVVPARVETPELVPSTAGAVALTPLAVAADAVSMPIAMVVMTVWMASAYTIELDREYSNPRALP